MIVAIMSSLSVFAAGSAESATNVKVGFIGPMTGDYGNYGDLISKGVLLAIDEKKCNWWYRW